MSLEFKVWRDEEDPENKFGLECLAQNSEGAGRKVVNAEAVRKFEELKDALPRYRASLQLQPAAPLYMSDINLAGHEIGDRAVRKLVEALLSGHTRVSVIELYKNRLGDASAQALSVLLEHSGGHVHGYHLSHNYFSPLGVGLLLGAAVKTGFYPAWRQVTQRGWWELCPLWLRVEQQQRKWPALTGLREREQIRRAEMLLKEKEAVLLKRCQAAGRYQFETFPEDFKLLCMPDLEGGLDESMPSEEFQARSNSCGKWRCKHINKEEKWPVVHLPYFWSQRARTDDLDEASSLHKTDEDWKNWRPKLPISVMGMMGLSRQKSASATSSRPPIANSAGPSPSSTRAEARAAKTASAAPAAVAPAAVAPAAVAPAVAPAAVAPQDSSAEARAPVEASSLPAPMLPVTESQASQAAAPAPVSAPVAMPDEEGIRGRGRGRARGGRGGRSSQRKPSTPGGESSADTAKMPGRPEAKLAAKQLAQAKLPEGVDDMGTRRGRGRKGGRGARGTQRAAAAADCDAQTSVAEQSVKVAKPAAAPPSANESPSDDEGLPQWLRDLEAEPDSPQEAEKLEAGSVATARMPEADWEAELQIPGDELPWDSSTEEEPEQHVPRKRAKVGSESEPSQAFAHCLRPEEHAAPIELDS